MNPAAMASGMGKLRREVRAATVAQEALASELRISNQANQIMGRTLIAILVLALVGGAWAVTMYGGMVCV